MTMKDNEINEERSGRHGGLAGSIGSIGSSSKFFNSSAKRAPGG
jgi:hypothetical protein